MHLRPPLLVDTGSVSQAASSASEHPHQPPPLVHRHLTLSTPPSNDPADPSIPLFLILKSKRCSQGHTHISQERSVSIRKQPTPISHKYPEPPQSAPISTRIHPWQAFPFR